MNVEAFCPLCLASHILPAEMRGQKYRCDHCEEVFIVNRKSKTTTKQPPKPPTVKAVDEVVPVAEASPPAADAAEVEADAIQTESRSLRSRPAAQRRAAARDDRDDRDGDEDDGRKPKVRRVRRSGEVPVGLMIGGVAGALAILALIGLGVWWLFSSRSDRPMSLGPVVQNPPVNPPADAGKAVNRPPMPPPDANPPVPPPREQPKRNPPRPVPPPQRELPPSETIGWRVKIDPLAVPVKLPEGAKRQPIKFNNPAPDGVVYPTLPSPFVIVGRNSDARDERQVWNLHTGEKTGRFVGKIDCTPPLALAPDGAHFACVVPTVASTVDVWSIATGKATRLTVHPTSVFIDLLTFVAPGKLLTCNNGNGGKKRFQVWDVATGKPEREFEGPLQLERDSLALSPGGTYLAFANYDDLYVYDLKTGVAAGCRELPRPDRLAVCFCRGMAFSRDGKELAGIFDLPNNGTQIIVWDVARGDVVAQHTFPTAFPQVLKNAAGYPGAKIEWLHDGSGWLIYGQAIIDRTTGKELATLPMDMPLPGARRILDQDHIALVSGTFIDRALNVEKLPWEKINAARKEKR